MSDEAVVLEAFVRFSLDAQEERSFVGMANGVKFLHCPHGPLALRRADLRRQRSHRKIPRPAGGAET